MILAKSYSQLLYPDKFLQKCAQNLIILSSLPLSNQLYLVLLFTCWI